jgi:hypothetical protein
MYVYYYNIEARPCNHCCGREEISIAYCKCVALVTQHAMRTRYIVICGLTSSKFFHIIS